MAFIEDERPFMSLTLPGSHNSATYTTRDYVGPAHYFICCQTKTVKEQLEAGIRVLDVRVTGLKAYGGDELWCSHTVLAIKL